MNRLPELVAGEAWPLLAGILLVLTVASLVGTTLRVLVARRRPHPAIDNLNSRIRSWWIIAGVCGLASLAGRTGLTLLFAFASLVALGEFLGTAKPEGVPRVLVAGCFTCVLPLQYLLVWRGDVIWFCALIPCLALVVLPLLLRSPRTTTRHSLRTLQWGLLVCVFSLSFVPALLTLPIVGQEHRVAYLPVFLLLVVQSSDVLQYLWGKLAGRHAIAPRISPAKTIEGTVGGILSATALGTSLAAWTPFTPTQAALVSLLLTSLGFVGGLCLSAIKRQRGIKDWGETIPGHGGMLDRLDSLCLAAPAFYVLLHVGWTT